MTKDDYVIVLGDFGIWRDSPQQRWYLNWLEERNFTTLFIDGNHECYDILDAYPVEEWHGGKVHFIKPSVIHLMRGQVFDIDDLKFFTFGGAASHDISDGVLEIDDPRVKEWRDDPDKMYRINHISWWEREMPNQEEMDEGIENLAKHNNKRYWKALVRWLPNGWLQTRTLSLNYENLRSMYFQRKSHKLTEWHQFCDWILTLPYAKELITYTKENAA